MFPCDWTLPRWRACDQPCRLGIFADEVDVPLYVLEWRRYRFGGLGRTERRVFCTVFGKEA